MDLRPDHPPCVCQVCNMNIVPSDAKTEFTYWYQGVFGMPHILHAHHISHNLFVHMLCFLRAQIAIKKLKVCDKYENQWYYQGWHEVASTPPPPRIGGLLEAAGGGDYPLVPPHPAAGITLQAVQTALLHAQDCCSSYHQQFGRGGSATSGCCTTKWATQHIAELSWRDRRVVFILLIMCCPTHHN